MRTISIKPTFEAWRDAARSLLQLRTHPDEILWSDDNSAMNLFADDEPILTKTPIIDSAPRVSPAFLDLAKTAAAHTDPRRWGLLYQLLWRHTWGGEKHLMQLMTDPMLRIVLNWSKNVSREIHKFHAFVRFRLVGIDAESGREQFVAWFEPEYSIVRMASTFFVKRFASMDWAILTPHECAHWDGKKLHFTPGVSRDAAPDEDALDELWRTYYRNIFNPARLKINAMRSEMPKRYWKNLPEASIIGELIGESQEKVQHMFATEQRPVKPAPQNAYLDALRAMNENFPDATNPPDSSKAD